MKKEYPKFKRGEVEKLFKKLPESEKNSLEDYLTWRTARGCGDIKLKDVRRTIIQIRNIIEKPFKDFKELTEHTQLVVLIKKSYFSNDVKKNMLIEINNLFSYTLLSLWDIRFKDLYSCKKKKGEGSETGYKYENDLITTEEVEKMFQLEKDLFWRTFLLVEDVTGMRIIETRHIQNKGITFNQDKTSTIEIFMTKIGKPKVVFLDMQTTDFIKKLQETQKNENDFGKYLFHSPKKPDIPIHKNAVNKWFKELSIQAIGKHHKPYELRHKRATALYKLSKQGRISEFATLRLMGHSRSMRERYDKEPKKEEIKILKEQAFKELSPEKEHQLETKIKELTRSIEILNKRVEMWESSYEFPKGKRINKPVELINRRK